MFNKRQSLALITLTLLLAGIADTGMAKSVLKFRPPSRGTLSITRGGASRGGSEPVNQLQMIAPQTSIGYTTDAYPTLMVYIPKTSAKMMVLRIRTADGKKTLFKKEMAVPPMPGVVRVNFENASLPPLEVNSQYRWSVSLLANVVDRSTATLIEGKLERIQPDAMLSQRLAKATPQEKAFLYAESGVWWNALLTLDDLRKAQPDDVALSQHWMSLLDSVGMGAIAPTPILPTPDLKP